MFALQFLAHHIVESIVDVSSLTALVTAEFDMGRNLFWAMT
ncbi:hypothetical protein [Mesorhizobium sp. M0909]